MPRPGGESDKLGNKFESLWTTHVLLRIASEEFDSIVVEPEEFRYRGFEFVLHHLDGRRELHTAKRQRSQGEWTIAALSSRGSGKRSIFDDIFRAVREDASATAVFISSTGATELRELVDRARQFDSSPDFEANIRTSKKLNDSLRKRILPLLGECVDKCHGYLQRIDVRLTDHRGLNENVGRQIRHLVYRPDNLQWSEEQVSALLSDFILETLGKRIRYTDVWEFLNLNGYFKRDWATDPTARCLLQSQNDRFLRSIESQLLNGSQLRRSEANQIVCQILDEEERFVFMIAAPAGMGKSCVLAQALRSLNEQGIPTLGIRMGGDTGVRTTRQLGKTCDLHDSPALVLEGVANGNKSVLLIDQVDTLSFGPGSHFGVWNVTRELLAEAGLDDQERCLVREATSRNMRVVLACRDFDIQNDYHLRKFSNRQDVGKLTIAKLDLDQVATLIAAAGGDLQSYDDEQLELLRIPLHLWLLFSNGFEDETEWEFRSSADLFDRFWMLKHENVNMRVSGISAWNAVIDRICEEMSARCDKSVSEILVDEWPETVRAMLTEGVLVQENQRLCFFHDSFFDYAYARNFFRKDGELIALLKNGEQHLFRRSQVRQILTFLRDQDLARYLPTIHEVLASKNVRFHIKRVVCGWIGLLTDPTREDWEIVASLWEDPSLRGHLIPAIRNNPAWFDLLDSLGVLQEWLNGSNEDADRAVGFLLLEEVQCSRSYRAAELLASKYGESERWNERVRTYFELCRSYSSRPIQELFLRLFEDGMFERGSGSRNYSWWQLLHGAAQQQPKFVLEVLTKWLDIEHASLSEEEDRSRLFQEFIGPSGQRLLEEVVAANPREFVDEILPRVLSIVRIALYEEGWGLRSDRIWGGTSSFRSSRESDVVLAALSSALQLLAQDDQSGLLEIVNQYFLNDPVLMNSQAVALLFLAMCSSAPSMFGDLCARKMVENPNLLTVGFLCWQGPGSPQCAVSRDTLAVSIPFASREAKRELENVIRKMEFRDESSEFAGWHERLLLESFGNDHLSTESRERLSVLRERFPNQDTSTPSRDTDDSGFIGSPIPEGIAKEMDNSEWLQAMKEYDRGWESPSSEGGAVELSRVLTPLTAQQPHRFCKLLHKMGDDIRPEYFEAILDGIVQFLVHLGNNDESSCENERILDEADVAMAIRRAHDLPARPCGLGICDVIGASAKLSLPLDRVEIVRYYALRDPSPPRQNELENRRDWNGEDVFTAGINSVRGRAARAIRSLLWADSSQYAALFSVIEEMVRDPTPEVRACVMHALLALLKSDPDRAVNFFVEACGDDPLLIGGRPFREFVRYAAGTYYDQLRETLLAGVRSTDADARSSAAKEICLAALRDETAEIDAADIRNSSDDLRASAAEVYARNVSSEKSGSTCREFVLDFFDDPDLSVREAAASCFYYLSDLQTSALASLIERYCDSAAFPLGYDALLYHLEETQCKLPDLTIRLAERFVKSAGREMGDLSRRFAGDAMILSKLIVRLYTQTRDERIRIRCLDVIDAMERDAAIGIDKLLAEFDR